LHAASWLTHSDIACLESASVPLWRVFRSGNDAAYVFWFRLLQRRGWLRDTESPWPRVRHRMALPGLQRSLSAFEFVDAHPDGGLSLAEAEALKGVLHHDASRGLQTVMAKDAARDTRCKWTVSCKWVVVPPRVVPARQWQTIQWAGESTVFAWFFVDTVVLRVDRAACPGSVSIDRALPAACTCGAPQTHPIVPAAAQIFVVSPDGQLSRKGTYTPSFGQWNGASWSVPVHGLFVIGLSSWQRQ